MPLFAPVMNATLPSNLGRADSVTSLCLLLKQSVHLSLPDAYSEKLR